ncbi:hypothetical protein BpHYR1_034238 [Brachionus plicatilis]|uniref:Uncharacterized protein n=1 Tax=Brachionus plicatilis TaxID=10195 RepID=A0A3M7RX06_BRAPC|nr:hypothetical protein BpHYR1_034238 [Brachionus plicatilis]
MMQLIVVFPLIDRMRQSALDDVGKALKSWVGYIIGTFEHLFSNKSYEKIKCYFNVAASSWSGAEPWFRVPDKQKLKF